MSSLGHPLAGDDLYGGSLELIKRQALHACRLHFVHPITGQQIDVRAELPEDMKSLLA
jgi:23S rRNA pseudouridine1911/1915/1917 synthase